MSCVPISRDNNDYCLDLSRENLRNTYLFLVQSTARHHLIFSILSLKGLVDCDVSLFCIFDPSPSPWLPNTCFPLLLLCDICDLHHDTLIKCELILLWHTFKFQEKTCLLSTFVRTNIQFLSYFTHLLFCGFYFNLHILPRFSLFRIDLDSVVVK